MAESTVNRCRLCLVAPSYTSAQAFAPLLSAAITGGDIATLFVHGETAGTSPQAVSCRHAAQQAGIAVIALHNASALGEEAFDGLQISVDDVTPSAAAPNRQTILGVDGITSRHAAMSAGESGADYLFFGRFDGDDEPSIFAPALELAAWWAEVAVVPALIMGGNELDSVDAAAAAGIDFVVLGRAIWQDNRGPAAAVADVNARLGSEVAAA